MAALIEGWSLEIDRDRCIGSGTCVAYAERTFTQDGEAKVELIDPPGDPLDVIEIAVEGCPTGALRLIGAQA